MIQISQPVSLSMKGKRERNEDSVFPVSPTLTDRIFLVCDGVGGWNFGDAASKIASSEIHHYLSRFEVSQLESDFTRIISDALVFARAKLEQYQEENKTGSKMASTLTLLVVLDNAIVWMHMGDSRIYHFRNGNILNMTVDHKMVTQLVLDGVISEEDAKVHPMRNTIDRAFDTQHKDQKAEITVIPGSDLEPGDAFLLCSDGVLEAFSDDQLASILDQDQLSIVEKLEVIQKQCDDLSNDNFSLIMFSLDEVSVDSNSALYQAEAFKKPKKKQKEATTVQKMPAADMNLTQEHPVADEQMDFGQTTKEPSKSISRYLLPGIFSLAILAGGIWWGSKWDFGPNKPKISGREFENPPSIRKPDDSAGSASIPVTRHGPDPASDRQKNSKSSNKSEVITKKQHVQQGKILPKNPVLPQEKPIKSQPKTVITPSNDTSGKESMQSKNEKGSTKDPKQDKVNSKVAKGKKTSNANKTSSQKDSMALKGSTQQSEPEPKEKTEDKKK
jgi:protein phosphatase